ncbi:hypothetical protein EJB05_25833, partial [Eragrostis curvula]
MELVVGASSATMKSVLGKLGNLLAQEYDLIRGVRGDIQYINDELSSMQAFLRDLSASPDDQDNRMKDWMKQIRDMAYDCEDCIDDFAHRLPEDSKFSGKCSFLVTRMYELWTWWPRREIASNIADLKVRAQQIAERRVRYGVNDPSKGPGAEVHPATYDIAEHQLASRQIIGTKEPVGMSTAMKELEKWIAKPDEAPDEALDEQEKIVVVREIAVRQKTAVLSLVGFGGVGKTTIAKALYQNARNEFDCRASVTVSQIYDEEAVLISIMNQVMPQETDHEQQGSRTGSSKNLAAQLRSTLKRVVSPLGRQREKVNDGNSEVKKTKIEMTNRDQRIKELKEHLAEKRYLLLVDDIWSAKTWESIRTCLPENNEKGSRIIVTTRFQAVGATCLLRFGSDLLYPIDFLDSTESKILFHKSFSESKGSKNSEGSKSSEEVSKNSEEGSKSSEEGSKNSEEGSKSSEQGSKSSEQGSKSSEEGSKNSEEGSRNNEEPEYYPDDIWKRCGGLPLVIVTMAGLVACNTNKTKPYWDMVCKSIPDHVATLTLEGVTRILNCCYNDLPGDLKTCSLYFSIFPKGWKISRKRLTRRWTAEGFVSEKQGLTEEEVAETYFNQLIRRKIIRPVEHSSNGKVKTFQVHDMVLEYIVSKSSEENFITVVGGHWMLPPPSNKVRRLSMQSSGSKHGNSTKGMNLSQVRSLTVFGSHSQLPLHSFNNAIIQVLDLEGWTSLKEKHMNDICKMLMLKYLGLRRTNIDKIPPEIEKLEYLETLDIRDTNVVELPRAVGQLKRISGILGGSKNPQKGLRMPQEKAKDQRKNKDTMKALRVLSGIEITGESTAVAGLHQLTGLKKLAIYKLSIPVNSETFNQLRSSIEYLCSCGLQNLAINDEGSHFVNSLDSMASPPRYLIALELSGKLKQPPQWISKLNTLNKLTLSVTVLRIDTFKLIRNLPSLFSLTFSLSAVMQDKDIDDILEKNKSEFEGEIFVPSGFKSLKLIRFFAPRVPKLCFFDNAMPALEMIDMQFETLEGLFGMDTLKNLKEVHLRVSDQADEVTKCIVDDLKNNSGELKVIVDHIVTA